MSDNISQEFMAALAEIESTIADVKPFEKPVPPSAYGNYVCELPQVMDGCKVKDGQKILWVSLKFKVVEGPEAGKDLPIFFDLLKKSQKTQEYYQAASFRGLLGRVMNAADLDNPKWVEIGLVQLRSYSESKERFVVQFAENKKNPLYPNIDVLSLVQPE